MAVWTPYFRLTNSAGGDITPFVASRLISLTYEEQAQDKSDRLSLTLSDRLIDGNRAELPEPDARITLELGYREADAGYEMGTFRVDDISWSGPPDTVEVTASGAALSQAMRAPVDRSWHDTTLGAIARTIARENGLEARVAADLAGIKIDHADQKSESPMAFLTRLTKRHDAVARPLGDLLVIAPKGEARAVSGRELPTFGIEPTDITSWSYAKAMRRDSGSAEPDKGGVIARWYDSDENTYHEVKVGQEPYENLIKTYDTEREARAAAAAKMNESGRRQETLTLSVPGRPDIVTEARLDLLGWRAQVPVSWRIVRASHQLSGDDTYKTEIEAERFRPDQVRLPDFVA